MSKFNRLLFILFILVFSTIVTFGSGADKAGSSAASQLRIPIGARYLALGGSQIAAVDGLDAIFWNPAGLDFSSSSTSAMFSHRNYFADMGLDYFALSSKFGDFGSIGLSFKSLNIGDINVTTMNQPDGTGEIISPNFFTVGLSYSNRLTDRIGVGINFNIISESFGRVGSSGFSIDAGVQYRDLMDVKGLALGVSVKNLGGSMKYDGNATFVQAEGTGSSRGPTWYKIDAASSPLPSEMSLGLSYIQEIDDYNNLTISTAYSNNNYTFDDYRLGMEYTYNNLLYLRGGYIYSPQATEDTPNIFGVYSFGAGINFMKFTNVNLNLDYAFVPVEFFNINHTFTINIGF